MRGLVFAGLLVTTTVSAHAQALFGEPFANGLDGPVQLVQEPTRRNYQYIVQLNGLIHTVKDGVVLGTPLVDLGTDILLGNEQGVVGMAFAPDFATSKYVFLNFTKAGPSMQVARYTMTSMDPPTLDTSTRLDIISTPRVNNNHNGGAIKFGPDGYLYIGMGDGGGAGDTLNNSQNPNTLLGKMVRIDPRFDDFPADPNKHYRIPANNPFVNGVPIDALKEIWAFGLRNPFRFSFDDPNLAGNGALIIGDVGQDLWEEIDYQPAGQGGRNYGWRRFEGFYQYSNTALAFQPDVKPSYVYPHTFGSSVTGGVVYRGLELGGDMFGRYFFGDFITGKLCSFRFYFDPPTNRWRAFDFLDHTAQIGAGIIGNVASIDVDSYGEMHLVDYTGNKVTKVRRSNATWLSDMTVPLGILKSGAIRSLIGNDDTYLIVETPNAQATKTLVVVIGKTNRTNRTALDLDLVGRVLGTNKALLRVYLRRWSDSQLVQVRAENMDGTKRRFRMTGLSHADYVRADGRIEVRMSVERTGVAAGALSSQWDQVLPTVR